MNDAHATACWSDAMLAASLIAVDPAGLRGACVRAGHGEPRERWLATLRELMPAAEPMRRIPVGVADERLLGGLDLTATLRAGRPVAQLGLLAESDRGIIVLPMAERFKASTLAHIGAALDTDTVVMERNGIGSTTATRIGVIALDESIEDEEPVSARLLDRLAFAIDLRDLRVAQLGPVAGDARSIQRARARLAGVRADAVCEAICAVAAGLGIGSIRASIMALRAACAIAALAGRDTVSEADAMVAARLVLAPRATRIPADETPPEAPSESPSPAEAGSDSAPPRESGETRPDSADTRERGDGQLEERMLAATAAAIPAGLLQRLRMQKANGLRPGIGGRAGAFRASLRGGRPCGAIRGDPRQGARLNLIETLRAAVPWQAMRQRERPLPGARRLQIRREDFHVTRYRQRTPSTTIFVVDASGSSALNRLAEAKGAVELLLADCYIRRDQVAVIGFRGSGAQLLLPPTRSLLRAKRSLAGLPGGGGTPLAAAIDTGVALAERVRRAGFSAALVLLTDGRANIARDGSGGRERAEADARAAALRVRSAALGALFLDISPRPQRVAAELAAAMGAVYLPLPHADAVAMSNAVRNSLPALAR